MPGMNQELEMPKQYDHKENEKRWREFWEQEKIYKFEFDPARPFFIIDTPPPYVSAEHLHMGHIMSYAQAEFIVRYKRMRGLTVFYPMGFDDNGLPTERFVENKYKIDKSKIAKSEFIKLCLRETELGAKSYKELWSRLGISVDWSKTYSTISPLATKVSQWSLLDLHKKGALYRSENPILWCTRCQTAISQADLEDQEKDSKMNHIVFKATDGRDLIVATTRPELIPACVALYVHPADVRYKNLIGQKAAVPLFNYEVPVKTSEAVDLETGTGLMMVCTWGDREDLEKWRVDKLETRAVVTEKGLLNDMAGSYAGLDLLAAREKIIADLQKEGHLIQQENVTHILNTHERCGTPAEFVLSKQWFIKIADSKDVWLKYGKQIKWYPAEKQNDYELWVNSLKWDWCVSRQRYYGVPFPIWYCADCEEPVFAREEDLPVNPSEDKPPTNRCLKCGGEKMVPEIDVMDTWATSSCTPFLLRELVDDKETRQKLFPATLRPNAFEIIRTWDFYSVVKSHYHFGALPFRDVMISGHGLDEKGKKFSKRLGNYVPADKLLDQYGADAVRYWATGAILGQNLRFNVNEIEKGKRTVIKLWNAARFLSLYIQDPCLKDKNSNWEPADAWIAAEFNKTLEKTSRAFENYAYAKAKEEIDDFFWSKFADRYVEFVKYRLFEDDKKSKAAAAGTLYFILAGIVKMYAPLLPFVTEEIYHRLFANRENKKSVHLSSWPEPLFLPSPSDIADFPEALAAIDEIKKFKSENGLSLGAEIEEYTLRTKINLEKYGDFVGRAIRVKNLKTARATSQK